MVKHLSVLFSWPGPTSIKTMISEATCDNMILCNSLFNLTLHKQLQAQYFCRSKDSGLWHKTPSPCMNWVGSRHDSTKVPAHYFLIVYDSQCSLVPRSRTSVYNQRMRLCSFCMYDKNSIPQSPRVELKTPLALATCALPLNHNSRTTTNPHNPVYALHRW